MEALSSDTLRLEFFPSPHTVLTGPDNRGERQLVAALLTGIASHLSGYDALNVQAAVDDVAPLGMKKKIVNVGGADNVELSPGPLPRARLVDPAEIAFRLDELGAWLQDRLQVGPVPPDERVTLLNSVVKFYFDRLAELAAQLSSADLLDFLIRQNEAMVREEAERRLTLPTRIACFGNEGQLRDELEKKLPAIAVASIANRFLIEYVSAISPAGDQRIDLERYDELLSIASEIVNKGYLSDAIHFGLADPELSLLASGRLGTSRGDLFQVALAQFRGVRARGDIADAHSHFARHWRDVDEPGEPHPTSAI